MQICNSEVFKFVASQRRCQNQMRKGKCAAYTYDKKDPLDPSLHAGSGTFILLLWSMQSLLFPSVYVAVRLRINLDSIDKRIKYD